MYDRESARNTVESGECFYVYRLFGGALRLSFSLPSSFAPALALSGGAGVVESALELELEGEG